VKAEVREPSATYLVRAGYKQTEIGLLPADWQVEQLGDCASFRTGPFGSALHKSDYVGDGVPVINPMHINDGRIEPNSGMTVSEKAAGTLNDFRLKAGEIVMGRRGDMGRCAVVKPEQAGWLCGTGSMIIRGREVDERFLQRVLSSPRAVASIEEASVGSTMVNLNQATLARLKVQLPPVAEQSAIAKALADMDALLAGLNRLIAKKRDLKQAAMQQLLTGQTRLPGFQGEWAAKRLGDLLIILHGKNQREVEVPDGLYPILATGGQIGTASRALYDKPSVLIGRKGTINQPRYMETPFWTVDTLFYSAMKADSNAKFLYYHFCLIDWMQYNEASGVPSLNARTIERVEIAVPTVAEQTAIATFLSDMDAELTALEARRDKTRALKQGMMQELLTGRTRLV
jgi:type I restriction enzyme, S subunit